MVINIPLGQLTPDGTRVSSSVLSLSELLIEMSHCHLGYVVLFQFGILLWYLHHYIK